MSEERNILADLKFKIKRGSGPDTVRPEFCIAKIIIMTDVDGNTSDVIELSGETNVEDVEIYVSDPEGLTEKYVDTKNEEFLGVDVRITTLKNSPKTLDAMASQNSLNAICRICHCDSSNFVLLGPLESPCHCKGSLKLVHISCLERWLKESGKESCELCGFQFKTEKIPQYTFVESVVTWMNTDVSIRTLIVQVILFLASSRVAQMATRVLMNDWNQLWNDGYRSWPTRKIFVFICYMTVVLLYHQWLVCTLAGLYCRWSTWCQHHTDIHIVMPETKPTRATEVTLREEEMPDTTEGSESEETYTPIDL